MSKLLAPNGKPSKLTAEQYKLVRSSAFKKWFGDWENDPANASKIIDKETKEKRAENQRRYRKNNGKKQYRESIQARKEKLKQQYLINELCKFNFFFKIVLLFE